MNNKKLLIATLATAFSGMISASEVTILPHPFPIEQPKSIDFTHLSPEQILQECKKLGIKTPEYKELKSWTKEAREIIEKTGTVDLTPEGHARKEACIKAIVDHIAARKEVFAEKINETTSVFEDAAAKAKEAAHDLAEKLTESGDKQ